MKELLTFVGCLIAIVIFILLHYYAVEKIVNGLRSINKYIKTRNNNVFLMATIYISIGIIILAFCIFCIFLYIIYIEEFLGKHIN
jgi:uncharacterized protein YacL